MQAKVHWWNFVLLRLEQALNFIKNCLGIIGYLQSDHSILAMELQLQG